MISETVVQTLVWGCGDQWVSFEWFWGRSGCAGHVRHSRTYSSEPINGFNANAGFLDYSQTGNRIGCDMPARRACRSKFR